MNVAASKLAATSFQFVRKLVGDRSTIPLRGHEAYSLATGLAPLEKEAGRAPQGRVAADETGFFGDAHSFVALQETVLPALLRYRSHRRTINIWSAACSSGQEPYSIAFLLRDQFPELATWNVAIYATDLSDENVKRASSGVYSPADVNRGLPTPYLTQFFEKVGDSWIVKPEIRSGISFQRLNLLGNWSALPTMDIVFLSKLLIQVEPVAQRTMWDKVLRQLGPDGRMLLGDEMPLGLDCGFTRVGCGSSCYYVRA